VPVAATAAAADGTTIAGADGLRDYLLSRRAEVFAHFDRKLLGYALGRAVLPGDTKLLGRMADARAAHGDRFAPAVEAVVTSPQFRRTRVEK
jgi:hypothetical protein